MPDLLVNLLELPTRETVTNDFLVRRAQPFELTIIPDSEPGIYAGLLKKTQ